MARTALALTAATAALALALGLGPRPAHAAPGPDAKREIAALMGALEQSGCRFERNGAWHDPAAARAHLQRKYDALLRRDLVDTAEQFIERAASRSSTSGRAYHVRCAGGPVREAGAWFREQLQRVRAGGGR